MRGGADAAVRCYSGQLHRRLRVVLKAGANGERTVTHANGNYRTTASREDESLPDFDAREGGYVQHAIANACGNRAGAGCANREAGGSVQAEENDICDDRIRRYRRIAEGSREKFRFAGAVARSGRVGARGAA